MLRQQLTADGEITEVGNGNGFATEITEVGNGNGFATEITENGNGNNAKDVTATADGLRREHRGRQRQRQRQKPNDMVRFLRG
jgi:hypothetical protein